MDFLSGLNTELDYQDRLKKELKIGLFGSFQRPHLERLKRHLCACEGFDAQISSDLCLRPPQGGDFNFRMGERLIEESQVHIFHFFREDDGETGINGSATLEIGIVFGKRSKDTHFGRYVLILCEEGYYERNIGNMPWELRPRTAGEWRWHDFETLDEMILHATQFCYDCLLDHSLRH